MTAEVIPIRGDLTNADYHKQPSLSSSGARQLISGTPAQFKWWRENEEHKPSYDLGNAAHAMVLGDPTAKLVKVDATDWRTKAAQEARKEAHTNGQIPLLLKQLAEVEQMADAIRAHPLAAALFDPDYGKPEQSFNYTDEATGVALRCRVDWLPDKDDGGMRMLVPDYKTTGTSASNEAFVKSAISMGYHAQAAWYSDALEVAGHCVNPVFLFVVQEVKAPYQVNVIRLSDMFVHIGRTLNRQAIDLYRACVDADDWPSYPPHVQTVEPPSWYLTSHLNAELEQL